MATFKADDIYEVQAVRKACDLLKAFQAPDEVLRLGDLVSRTGINTTTAFRLLHTLEQQGLIEKVRRYGYRSLMKPTSARRYTFGYASQGEDRSFAQEWTESIAHAAASHNIELISLDNGFNPEIALKNADRLVDAKVDVAIEHQFNDKIAPLISAKFQAAKIPLIAMGASHPGATYFGGNNYGAGLIGGHALGRWAMQQWGGRVDELVLVELSIAGAFLRSRLNGVEMGVREILPGLRKVTRLACAGQFSGTMDLVRQYLKTTRARRILLGAVNDPCALGALKAFEEMGWQDPYAVVGQGGAIEARRELRRRGTHLIGTVGFFPETYGESIMRIAVNLLNARAKPSAVFTKHQLITAANVDRFYPNDLELHLTPPAFARVERLPC